jgi:hypothetical protein
MLGVFQTHNASSTLLQLGSSTLLHRRPPRGSCLLCRRSLLRGMARSISVAALRRGVRSQLKGGIPSGIDEVDRACSDFDTASTGLPPGSHLLLHGPAQSGKSVIALQMAAHVLVSSMSPFVPQSRGRSASAYDPCGRADGLLPSRLECCPGCCSGNSGENQPPAGTPVRPSGLHVSASMAVISGPEAHGVGSAAPAPALPLWAQRTGLYSAGTGCEYGGQVARGRGVTHTAPCVLYLDCDCKVHVPTLLAPLISQRLRHLPAGERAAAVSDCLSRFVLVRPSSIREAAEAVRVATAAAALSPRGPQGICLLVLDGHRSMAFEEVCGQAVGPNRSFRELLRAVEDRLRPLMVPPSRAPAASASSATAGGIPAVSALLAEQPSCTAVYCSRSLPFDVAPSSSPPSFSSFPGAGLSDATAAAGPGTGGASAASGFGPLPAPPPLFEWRLLQGRGGVGAAAAPAGGFTRHRLGGAGVAAAGACSPAAACPTLWSAPTGKSFDAPRSRAPAASSPAFSVQAAPVIAQVSLEPVGHMVVPATFLPSAHTPPMQAATPDACGTGPASLPVTLVLARCTISACSALPPRPAGGVAVAESGEQVMRLQWLLAATCVGGL